MNSSTVSSPTVFYPTSIAIAMEITCLVGIFANIAIITAIIREKTMRSRCHVLIASLAFVDIVECVYLIQVRAEILVGNIFLTNRQCVLRMVYGLFFENLQCTIGLALGVDRLLAVVAPIRYRQWLAHKYLILMLLPCCIFSIALTSFCLWESSDTSRVAICFTPTAYINRAKQAWYGSNIAIISLEIAAYTSASMALRKMTGPNSIHIRKILLSLETVMVVYCVSWALPIFTNLLLQVITVSADVANIVRVLLGWPVILNAGCNFFIYAARSSEFRVGFRRLFLLTNTKATPAAQTGIPRASRFA